MQTETIQVTYVNQPKTPKGPGSVKDSTGRYWKVWPGELAKFSAGGTYKIGYESGSYHGKEEFTVKEVAVISAAPSGSQAPAAAAYNPDRETDIAVLALVKEWVDKIPVGDLKTLEHALRVCRAAWQRHKIPKQKPEEAPPAVPSAPSEPRKFTRTEADMDDEIPF